MRRLISILPGLGMLLLGVLQVQAAPPTPNNPAGNILGVVPSKFAGHNFSSRTSNLSYHNGPTMHTNRTYAIYWVPSGYKVDSGYESIINSFFQGVAADNGKTTNVYYSDTQYYDTSGSISYSSSFGGSYVDTNSFPANGCSDSYTSVCLSDAQIRSEINRVASAQGWARSGSLIFMFTAEGVGSCTSSSSCAFSSYCAYHSNFSSTAGNTLYANMPYADTVPAACDGGQRPNNDDADATLNVTSHEHNEAITDPTGQAWYDRQGYENGDKCAWNFGKSLGSTAYGQYNQVINGHYYYLQQEWSNYSSGCVLQGK